MWTQTVFALPQTVVALRRWIALGVFDIQHSRIFCRARMPPVLTSMKGTGQEYCHDTRNIDGCWSGATNLNTVPVVFTDPIFL